MAEVVTPKGGELWTTAEVAAACRVGVSSIKRWADEGELESVRTPGGHRRYTLPAIYRFASIRGLSIDLLPRLEQRELFEEVPEPGDRTLFDALAAGDADAVVDLVTPHVRSVVQRAAFLDRVVGAALREIGERWERGELGIEVEHRASNLLAESLDRLRPRVRRDSELAILACPPDELHDLPLRMVRLVFEWSGWRTELAGARLPWDAARASLRRAPAVLAFTARSSAPFHDADFVSLVADCESSHTAVIAGGHWARGGNTNRNGFLRFRTLRGFEKWLRTGRAEA